MSQTTTNSSAPIAARRRSAPLEGPNPYVDRTLQQLFGACQLRAAALVRRDRAYTAEERSGLARDTAYLLLAVSPALAQDEDVPGSPARAILRGHGDFVEELWHAHESSLRSARYRTLVMASDLALAGHARAWRRDGRIDDDRVFDVAMSSEMGLLRVLSELAKLRAAAPRRRT